MHVSGIAASTDFLSFPPLRNGRDRRDHPPSYGWHHLPRGRRLGCLSASYVYVLGETSLLSMTSTITLTDVLQSQVARNGDKHLPHLPSLGPTVPRLEPRPSQKDLRPTAHERATNTTFRYTPSTTHHDHKQHRRTTIQRSRPLTTNLHLGQIQEGRTTIQPYRTKCGCGSLDMLCTDQANLLIDIATHPTSYYKRYRTYIAREVSADCDTIFIFQRSWLICNSYCLS